MLGLPTEAREGTGERRLAGSTGLEPAASAVTGRRSNQLNYDPKENNHIAGFRVQISDWIVDPTRHFNPQSICNLKSANCHCTIADWAVQDSNL
jgi:hypothetical protein